MKSLQLCKGKIKDKMIVIYLSIASNDWKVKWDFSFLEHIFKVYHNVGIWLVCVPRLSCADGRPARDRTSCSTWMKASSGARMTPTNTACVMSKLWRKKKIPSCTLHWGNGNWEAPGYLSGFTRRHRLQNSNYTLRAPHLKHNSRKWRVHVMWIVSFIIQKARQAQELLLGPHVNCNNTCKWFTFFFLFETFVIQSIHQAASLCACSFRKTLSVKESTLFTATCHPARRSVADVQQQTAHSRFPYSAKSTASTLSDNNVSSQQALQKWEKPVLYFFLLCHFSESGCKTMQYKQQHFVMCVSSNLVCVNFQNWEKWSQASVLTG